MGEFNMGGLESIGGFIRKYGGKEAKDIIKKGGKDWNKNGKVEKEESADIDGNKKVTDEELAKFYIDNRSKFAKTSLNEYIFKSIDTIWGSTGADGDKTAKAEGTIPKITKAYVIDQEKADGYLSVLLNKSATFEQRLEAAKSLIEIFSVKAGFSKESASKFASLF